MAGVELQRVTRKRGHWLWKATFPGSRIPPASTQWYNILVGGGHVAGWIGFRFRARQGRRAASFVLDGVYVRPKWRGLNLQLTATEVAIERVCDGDTRCTTYVNACNTSSFLNLVESGFYPVGAFTEGKDTFINMEAYR